MTMPSKVSRGDFAIRIVHLNRGWVPWAFHRNTGYDEEFGLSPDGYSTVEDASKAIRRAVRKFNREPRART